MSVVVCLCTSAIIAVPVITPSCSLVEVTQTDMAEDDATTALSVYLNAVEPITSNDGYPAVVDGMAARLSEQLGGLWDVYSSGTAMSYSVYCVAYVELTGPQWLALLCKQSDKAGHVQMPCAALSLVSNGSLSRQHYFDALQGRGAVDLPETLADVELERFNSRWRDDSVEQRSDDNAAKEAALAVISAMPSSSVSSSVASMLRHTLEGRFASLPCRSRLPHLRCRWSVIVETQPAGLQFSEAPGLQMSVRDPLGLMFLVQRRQCQ